MKQEMPPKKRTRLFKVNLHKQKDKCWYEHKNAQANMWHVGFPSWCSGISRLFLCSRRANTCWGWKAMSVSTSPQSTFLSSAQWSFPERSAYFKETSYSTKTYAQLLCIGLKELPWHKMAAQIFFQDDGLWSFSTDLVKVDLWLQVTRMCAWSNSLPLL